MNELLRVENLRTWFATSKGMLRAVDGVDFTIPQGGTLGVVGESGSGKSVTALSVMRLVERPGRIEPGSKIIFEGRDLATLGERELTRIRGNDIAMIFQEPMTSLNPVFTVGNQIAEAVRLHQGLNRKDATERAVELMRLVGIPSAERRVNDHPHQMSGGMRQRVMIAMALACDPQLLIADEPTTALDVTIQAQILDLMRALKDKTGAAILLITHDLGVVAEMAQRVVVMYAGRKVEEAAVNDLFDRPRHPYTRGLMKSIPRLGAGHGAGKRLAEIPGLVPSLREPIVGCAFATRCSHATERCRSEAPPLVDKAPGHAVACWEADRLPTLTP